MSTIITRKQFPNYRKYTMDLAGEDRRWSFLYLQCPQELGKPLF